MKLEGSTVLITGAAGGIGSAVARRLWRRGTSLLLTDFRADALAVLARELEATGVETATLTADLGRAADRERLAGLAAALGVDVLINVAGINPFGLFAEQSDAEIERTFEINVLAPVLLCRALLPVLARADAARIVNVGSVFGGLAYPGFAVYSASKYAVRGFSEALRRELADTNVRVHYVAPRATRTALSTDRISAMNRQLKVATDSPETVAAAIETALTRSRRELYLGRPERLFALLNGVFPGLIDRVLARQLPVIKRFAARGLSRAPSESGSLRLDSLGASQ